MDRSCRFSASVLLHQARKAALAQSLRLALVLLVAHNRLHREESLQLVVRPTRSLLQRPSRSRQVASKCQANCRHQVDPGASLRLLLWARRRTRLDKLFHSPQFRLQGMHKLPHLALLVHQHLSLVNPQDLQLSLMARSCPSHILQATLQQRQEVLEQPQESASLYLRKAEQVAPKERRRIQ